MALSAIGYGKNPYGHPYGGSPFQVSGPGPYLMFVGYGQGDWAEEVTWKILPPWMRDEDGLEGRVPEPLRGFIDAVKPLLNDLLGRWRVFPALWDANACPLPQLPALAQTIGIALDQTKNERLQRSETLNATQLFLHKGTDLGYSILAAFEDLLVEVIPLWASDCSPTATLSPTPPSVFVPQYDEIPADEIPLDVSYDDQFAIWPWSLFSETICRSHSLRLVFYPTTNPNQDFDPDVAGRIAERVLRYKPIHVEIDRVTFDGLRGSSQEWVAPVVADNMAAGEWVGPVTAEMRAASQEWVMAVDAEPVP